jgi:Zn ribbon nucleic-acid-binding protein
MEQEELLDMVEAEYEGEVCPQCDGHYVAVATEYGVAVVCEDCGYVAGELDPSMVMR